MLEQVRDPRFTARKGLSVGSGLILGDPTSHTRGPELLEEEPGPVSPLLTSCTECSANSALVPYPCHWSLVSQARRSAFVVVSMVWTRREVTWGRQQAVISADRSHADQGGSWAEDRKGLALLQEELLTEGLADA